MQLFKHESNMKLIFGIYSYSAFFLGVAPLGFLLLISAAGYVLKQTPVWAVMFGIFFICEGSVLLLYSRDPVGDTVLDGIKQWMKMKKRGKVYFQRTSKTFERVNSHE